jgi:transposase
MARPTGSAELIEARCHQARRLLDEGYSLSEVGRLTRCTASPVIRWGDARERGGEGALKVRPAPGRPAALSQAQPPRILLGPI